MTPRAPIKDLIDQLMVHGRAHVPSNGSSVLVELAHGTELLTFQTVVYQAQNYIPPSVRLCLSPSFHGPSGSLRTSLSIDEESFSVSLHFQQVTHHLTQNLLMGLLEEFSWLSEEWRRVLDDHDKRDLVHVRVK